MARGNENAATPEANGCAVDKERAGRAAVAARRLDQHRAVAERLRRGWERLAVVHRAATWFRMAASIRSAVTASATRCA